MKTFVVGDVHGRCAQLHRLLEMLPRDQTSDMLVFLGDLVDRGPDAPGCVELVMNLQLDNTERVLCLRGNHEQMLLDFIDGSANLWSTRHCAASAALDARHGVLQKLSWETLYLWSHADAATSFVGTRWPPWNLHIPQRHRHRYRLQPSFSAHVSFPA